MKPEDIRNRNVRMPGWTYPAAVLVLGFTIIAHWTGWLGGSLP